MSGPKPTKAPPDSVASRRGEQPSWDEIADGFETLGKVGLALAIGMSAAGLFCRLAEQGKVRVPSLSSLVVGRAAERPPSHSKVQAQDVG